jgi:hypothetical protein
VRTAIRPRGKIGEMIQPTEANGVSRLNYPPKRAENNSQRAKNEYDDDETENDASKGLVEIEVHTSFLSAVRPRGKTKKANSADEVNVKASQSPKTPR